MAEKFVWVEKDGQKWKVSADVIELHLADGFKLVKGKAGEEPEGELESEEPKPAAKKSGDS